MMTFENEANENISMYELDSTNSHFVPDVRPTDMTMIWNTGEPMDVVIDGIPYRLLKNQIIFLTEFYHIDSIHLDTARMVRFNQPFYCIVNHDTEVGCKGLLFFGASGIPIVTIDEDTLWDFETSWEICKREMRRSEILKKDMLQAILKRMLILSTRLLRKSTNFKHLEKSQADIVREFNYLVERHFAQHHDVAFYASQLNKSPKTISNLFSTISDRRPQHIIHDRIMIHARRQIGYTGLPIKEIASQLGFDDIQAFSRFFKKKEGVSPLQYREKFLAETVTKGNIDNKSGIAA